jgi:hypothetical protein
MKPRSFIILSLLTGVILAGNSTPAVSQPQTLGNITQRLDLSKVVITQEDLPSDFKAATSNELEQLRRDISLQELPIQSVFQFSNDENPVKLGLIMGGTYWVSDSLAQSDFMSNPQRVMRLFTEVVEGLHNEMSGVDIGRQPTQQLTKLDGMGDFASGVSRVINAMGFRVRMEIVTFRRGRVLAFVAVGYLDGTRPAVSVADLARKLYSRIPPNS